MLTDDEIMAQVLAAFQAEQSEHRQAIGELLLELERDPQHPQRRALLDQLFRSAHSLKGGARAAGQPEVEQLAHAIEELLGAVRQERIRLSAQVCDPVYAAIDAIGVLMSQVAAGQPASLAPYLSLLETLERLGRSEVVPDALPSIAAMPPDAQNGSQDGAQLTGDHASNGKHQDGALSQSEQVLLDGWSESDTTVRVPIGSLDALLHETGELIAWNVRHQQRTRDAQQQLDLFNRWRRVWRSTGPVYSRMQRQMQDLRPTVHYLPGYQESRLAAGTALADRETGVLLHALSQAHELIGELERQLGRQARELVEDSSRLEALSDRLHSQVRRTRMLPLATLWGPVRLQVREMARAAGKDIALDLDDGGAEADRQVLDQLREVLLHLLRNAVDHGIESPEQRMRLGKPPAGRLTLRTIVGGDRLVITLSDDGAGLDFEAIRERALAAGLLQNADPAHVTPAELTDLIFVPGFSTRATVSALSGRGVGLDIVRSQVERMHGRVGVQSVPGHGCVFTLSVPLSLTSAHGLLLAADDRLYALPIDAVTQILTITPASIQILEGRAMLVLDHRPVPLVHLGDALHGDTKTPRSRSGGVALLLSVGERQVACLVDAVLGEQELVVQRLPAPLQHVRYVAGATILSDSRIALILDLLDLTRGLLGSRSTIDLRPASDLGQRRARVLVVDDSITTRTLEKNILTAAGYEVLLAADGVEAFALLGQLFNSDGCDLLLSDVDMPRLNGFELTAQVRADSRFRHLPVVLMTSLDTPADRERGIAAGADAYLVKRGFSQQALLDLIASLL
jgi:two-component system, chemotaxis family, sensor kinase CheA